ncbi:MAG: dihydroneopterin triphosphate 2'-epimerase [Gammaproteobacteria bacterium]|nr:dihydroneopterin triphosphate 2'-epimerase [Gammaproteobacteria bacterium]
MNQAIEFARALENIHISRATIRVTNLRLRTYIGFNPEEKTKQQDVIINAEITYDARSAFVSDDEDDALNYKTITKRMIALVEGGKFHLLEKLTSDLLSIAMEPDQVREAKISVDKPHALRFAESVSITLSASRPQSLHLAQSDS